MKEFVEIVKKNYNDTDLILKAFDFACEAHKNAKRKRNIKNSSVCH